MRIGLGAGGGSIDQAVDSVKRALEYTDDVEFSPQDATRTEVPFLMRIVDAVDSPWLGVLADTGNFLDDQYAQFEKIAPKTVFVQAKTYEGGGEWYSLDIDYARIAKILAAQNYRGYVSLEFEGKAPAETAVPKAIAQLRAAFNA